MRNILVIVLSFFMSSSYSFMALPQEGSVHFSLAHIESGTSCPSFLQNSKVLVDYAYDFSRNVGLAHVRQFHNVAWVEALYPLGISSLYAFMSDMSPKTIHVAEGDVTVYRVIFHLHHDGLAQLYLMLGEDGDCIMSSDLTLVNNN